MKNFALINTAGYLKFKQVKVCWFLSVNYDVLPKEFKVKEQKTYCSITIEGEELEFSGGFTDLHTRSYEHILAGKGYSVEAPRQAIEIVHTIRHAKPIGMKGEYHPFVKKSLAKHPFER